MSWGQRSRGDNHSVTAALESTGRIQLFAV
jgi:hypothetical protein